MAKRGRKPVPTPVLKLRGGFRSDRHGRRLDADGLDHKRPACPQWLIKHRETADAEYVRRESRSLWNRLSPQLYQAGLLIDLYREMFAMLCDAWGRYRLACAKCDSEGMTTIGSKKNAIKSPWTAIRTECYKQAVELAGKFGLSPADLASVRSVEKPTADNHKAKFFQPRHNGA